jgi:glucan phosphoethanolaminetransferase (alkaline phosphatase superfamily)
MMVALTTVGGAESFLSNAVVWGVFSLFAVAIASLPAITNRDWTALVSWPLLTTMAIAVTARALGLYSEIAGHLTIAMLALIAVVELTTFTTVELSRRFAIAFAVLTTMAVQALWIVVQFYSDRWLGTGFLSTQTELQRDILFVTLVGLVVGVVCERYFAWFKPIGAIEPSSNWKGES